MRSKTSFSLLFFVLLALGAIAFWAAPAQANVGSCSPGVTGKNAGDGIDDTCFNNDSGLLQLRKDSTIKNGAVSYGTKANVAPVYYPGTGVDATGRSTQCSPTCMPYKESGFGGNPSPGGMRTPMRNIADADLPLPGNFPEGCAPANPNFIIPQEGSTPLKSDWSPIESIENLHAAAPGQWARVNSIGDTQFDNNAYASGSGVTGNGRYHLDNQAFTTPIQDGVGTTVFTSNGDPHALEGASDTKFAVLGSDGYVLGRFDTPVTDGPGFDVRVHTVHATGPVYGTFCLYGASSPTGPFTMVHSAFVLPGQPEFVFDMSYFYTPLRKLEWPADPSKWEMDYFLIVDSLDRTPYLKAGFDLQLPAPLPANNPELLTPLRGQDLTFTDTSVRFGYPMYYVWFDNSIGGGPPYTEDITNVNADPIASYDWFFPDDPYVLAPGVGVAVDRLALVHTKDATHQFQAPGTYTVCHAVHTADYPVSNPNPPNTVVLTIVHQSDPPLALYPADRPDPKLMMCKQVTVHNLPPKITFTASLVDLDVAARAIDLAVTGLSDPDWVKPLGCADCPANGIESVCWEFDTLLETGLPAAPARTDARTAGPWQQCWHYAGTAYNPAVDDPSHQFASDGSYLVTAQICDHDARNFIANPLPFVSQPGNPPPWLGDPEGASHGCSQSQLTVRIYSSPNQAPYLAPLTSWSAVGGSEVRLPIIGFDNDVRQTATMRLCDDPNNPPSSTFAPVSIQTSKTHVVAQSFTWDTRGVPLGTYGPICFQVDDGLATTTGYAYVTLIQPAIDSDQDGIADVADNCPAAANPDQVDHDLNGAGDACDTAYVVGQIQKERLALAPRITLDRDQDGIADLQDNCPDVSNADQVDLDEDHLGNACDLDLDGDAVGNLSDNCPTVYNPDQRKSMAGKEGIACTASSSVFAALSPSPAPNDSIVAQSDSAAARALAWMGLAAKGTLVLASALLLTMALVRVAMQQWTQKGNQRKR